MKKVLIADDSALVRKQLGEIIAELGFEIDSARNGEETVKKALATQYDVITMDINMPVLDGLSAVKEIMASKPTPILMISSLTTESASITMQALELGAVDYISKPGTMNVGKDVNRQDILEKVKSLSRIPPSRLKNIARREVRREAAPSTKERVVAQEACSEIKKVLLIGASTGGPGLIEQICSSLPANFPYAVFVVQHMPEQFTAAFATRLNRVSQLSVVESTHNMELCSGRIYLARGGVHMHFAKKASGKFVVREESNKNNQFFQPSVDEMFSSALKVFGAQNIVAVLLTGIGDDGADGMVAIKTSGGFTIGESEESAVVYGMPKEAYERGGVSLQLPFFKIVKTLQSMR